MFGSSVARLSVSLISANGKRVRKKHAHARDLKATRREGSAELRCYLRVACHPSFARSCVRACTHEPRIFCHRGNISAGIFCPGGSRTCHRDPKWRHRGCSAVQSIDLIRFGGISRTWAFLQGTRFEILRKPSACRDEKIPWCLRWRAKGEIMKILRVPK